MPPVGEITELFRKNASEEKQVEAIETRIREGDVMFSLGAQWCEPCKTLRKNIKDSEVEETLQQFGVDLYFVDEESNHRAFEYVGEEAGKKVMGIPLLVAFGKEGEYQGDLMGLVPNSHVMERLQMWYRHKKP